MKYLAGIVRWEGDSNGGRCWIDVFTVGKKHRRPKRKSKRTARCKPKRLISSGEVELLKLRQICKQSKNYTLADEARNFITDDKVFELIDKENYTEVWLCLDKLAAVAEEGSPLIVSRKGVRLGAGNNK